jgi:peptidoglycan hydrolase-like protein with peptidoglycan-binding domain
MNTMELKHGDKGENVRKLQEALVKEGFSIAVDGDFGDNTEKAVRAFQKREGLKVDGIAGKDTLTALGLALLLIELKHGDRGINVRKLQEALVKEGFGLALDGIFGNETEKAVRAFQKREGLKVDGIAGPNTLAALNYDTSGEVSKDYRIYPGIGIARIGNSDEMFIGPESPFEPVKGPFKKDGKIKKQGARFRIYEFEVDDFGREVVIQELTSSATVIINWHVHLCNRKAASRTVPKETAGGPTPKRNANYLQDELVIEAEKEISGANKRSDDMVGSIKFIKKEGNVLEGEDSVVLGRLETDNSGRLIVVGGNGISKSPLKKQIVNFANNPGWYDDCCDGPVRATIGINGETIVADSAWVVVASPAYAPEIDNVVTWYDQAKSVEVLDSDPGMILDKPSFTEDIYPILKRLSLLQWVSPSSSIGHASGDAGDFIRPDRLAKLADNSSASADLRQFVFGRLTPPGSSAPGRMAIKPGPKNMPQLNSGVDPTDRSRFQYPSLATFQYDRMEQWADGNFIADWKGEPPERALEDLPLSERPMALTRAALEDCIGGPFYPGIESTYLMVLPDTYEAPYRIRQTHPPGYMTELMAVPWQADFLACGALWWPAQRPVAVTSTGDLDDAENYSRGISSGADMVEHWSKLGFIVRDGDTFVEKERGNIPGA